MIEAIRQKIGKYSGLIGILSLGTVTGLVVAFTVVWVGMILMDDAPISVPSETDESG